MDWLCFSNVVFALGSFYKYFHYSAWNIQNASNELTQMLPDKYDISDSVTTIPNVGEVKIITNGIKFKNNAKRIKHGKQ